MENQIKQLDHAEIFASPESFKELLGPKKDKNSEKLICKKFQLPYWHPFKRAIGIIAEVELGEKVKVGFVFPVNLDIPFDESAQKGWIQKEIFEESFDVIRSYFVDGTFFGTEEGQAVLTNGPKEFTWTFKAPEGHCSSCGEQIKE